MAFDVNKLTLGEVDRIETLSGLSVSSFGDADKPKGKLLAAIAFVAKRREELASGQPPVFTWNDALELNLEQANKLAGFDEDDEDEVPPGEEPAFYEPSPEDIAAIEQDRPTSGE